LLQARDNKNHKCRPVVLLKITAPYFKSLAFRQTFVFIHHSSFISHHSSFIIHLSSFIIQKPGLPTDLCIGKNANL